jgi:hypothetical protein
MSGVDSEMFLQRVDRNVDHGSGDETKHRLAYRVRNTEIIVAYS